MLARKAAKLFVHAKDIIAKSSLASSIGQEYSALLRTHLLPVSQYCNVVSSDAFQGQTFAPLCFSVHLALQCFQHLAIRTILDHTGGFVTHN